MKAYKCDRCGRFYNEPVGQNFIVTKQGDVVNMLDLCPKCYNELSNWLDKKPLRYKPKKAENLRNPDINGGFVFE